MWDSGEEEEEDEDDDDDHEFQTTSSVVYYQCKSCSRILVSASKWDSHLSKCRHHHQHRIPGGGGGGGAIMQSIGFRLITFKTPVVVIEGRCDSNNKVGVRGIHLNKNKVMVQEEEEEGHHGGGGESSMRANNADGGAGNTTEERAQRCSSSRKSAQAAREKLHSICSEMRGEEEEEEEEDSSRILSTKGNGTSTSRTSTRQTMQTNKNGINQKRDNKRSKQSRPRHVSSGGDDDDDDSSGDEEKRRQQAKKKKKKKMRTSAGKPKTYCNRSTAGHTDLTFHPSCHRRYNNFKCPLCPGKYSTQKGLDSHVEHVHKGTRRLMPCAVCERVYNKRDILNSHILAHEAAEEREAKFNLLQPWGPDLLEHLQKASSRSGRVKNYDKNGVNPCLAVSQPCKFCLLSQCSYPNFIAHIVEEHTGANNNPPESHQFPCRAANCAGGGVKFSTIRELVEHVRATHPKYRGRLDSSTKIQRSRDDATTTTSSGDDKEQLLATTSKTTTSTHNSNNKIKIITATTVETDLTFHPSCDPRVNSFECPLCPGKFVNKKWLDSHVNKVHNGTRTMTPCAICGRVFNRTDSLNAHILAHEAAEAREAKFNLLQPWGQDLLEYLQKVRANNYDKNGVNHCWAVQQACKWCLLPQCSYPNFIAHIVEEHTAMPEEAEFSCRFLHCGLKFETIRELVAHVKAGHPKFRGRLTQKRLSTGIYTGWRTVPRDETGKVCSRAVEAKTYAYINSRRRGSAEPEPEPSSSTSSNRPTTTTTQQAKEQRKRKMMKGPPKPIIRSKVKKRRWSSRSYTRREKPVKSFTPFQEPVVSSDDERSSGGEEEGDDDDGSDWEREFRDSIRHIPKKVGVTATNKYDRHVPPEKRIELESVSVDEQGKVEPLLTAAPRVKREVKTEVEPQFVETLGGDDANDIPPNPPEVVEHVPAESQSQNIVIILNTETAEKQNIVPVALLPPPHPHEIKTEHSADDRDESDDEDQEEKPVSKSKSEALPDAS